MAVAAHPFAGFTPQAIQFLADLAENNDRAWFQPRKADYERLLKEPLEALCAALGERFAAAGHPAPGRPEALAVPDLPGHPVQQGQVALQDPPRRELPVDRDGRRRQGELVDAGAHGNGGYFNFQPGEMYAGGGMWMAEKPRLDAFRRAIVEDARARPGRPSRSPAFVAWFGGVQTHESLKRVPPGYPADHPMADMFRWKDVVFGRRLSDDEVCSPDLPDLLADGVRDGAPGLPVPRDAALTGAEPARRRRAVAHPARADAQAVTRQPARRKHAQ